MLGKRTSQRSIVARSVLLLLLEIMFAKEDKSRFALLWKTPRLSFWAGRGLQYGLSGNRVFNFGNIWTGG